MPQRSVMNSRRLTRSPRQRARRSLCRSALGNGDKIVLANPLQDEKRCRNFASVGNEMSAFRPHCIHLARQQNHFLLGVLQENTNCSFQDIECVSDVAVAVPRHFLRGTDLYLSYSKSWACGVIGEPLNLVQPARILYRLHANPS